MTHNSGNIPSIPEFYIVLHSLYRTQSKNFLKAKLFKYGGSNFNKLWQIYLMDSSILEVMTI